MSDPAERIRMETRAGDIELDVPAGSYRLRVGTQAGDRAVHDVRDDSEAPRTIDAFTRAGDIAVNGY